MSSSFYSIYKFILTYPKIALLCALFFLVGSLFVIKEVQFDEDITKVIPVDHSSATATGIAQQMSFTDKVSVIISKKGNATEEDLTEAAQAFLVSLENHQEYYYDVQGVLDEDLFNRSFQFVYRHLPIYLDENDYLEITKKIQPDSVKRQIDENYTTLMGTSAVFMKDVVVQDPLQLSFLALKKLQQFQGGSDYVFEDGFLFSQDKSKLFLFINPKYGGAETKNNELFVAKLRAIQDALNQEYPTVETSYFGAAFIAVANAQQIKHDILTTVAISISLLMLMLIFYYRNWLIPIIVMIPSVFGGLFALVCIYFIRSEISAISLSISAILIGITIDYALHFLTHSKGRSNHQTLFRDVSRPLLMSSSTTAIAFLCLLFVRSEALIDLGIFASIAVVATAIFTLIVLPHAYKGKEISHTHTIDRIAKYPFEKNKILIGFSLLLIVVSLFTYHKVSFDGDLAKINYIPQDQQEAERALNQGQEQLKNLFVVSYGADPNEVLESNEQILSQLENNEHVVRFQSVNSLMPSRRKQEEAIIRWQQFWTDGRKAETIEIIERESVASGFVEQTHQPFYDALATNYASIDLGTLRAFDEQFYREFVHSEKDQTILSSLISVRPDERDDFVRSFEAKSAGNKMLIVDRQALNEQYLAYLIDDFNSLVSYSFVAVFFVLFVFYKRIELVLVASVPIALTGFITTGIMGLLGVPFNIFSTIVCTLIFGHGIDFTIFMTSALQKQYTNGKDEMPIFRTSIILAVLTTILAIGALIFARHPALQSISAIALIGVTVAILVTFVLYPILFKWLFYNRVNKGLSPVSLKLLLQSFFQLAYFAIASVIVSSLIRGFVWILPLSKRKKEGLSAKWVSWYMRLVLYLNPRVKKRVFNKHRTADNKPSILIANHSSFLDSLSMGMLHEKVVFLVNDWVYNSPIFGRAVRALGFLPTSSGVAGQLDKLKNRIADTFSIVIFPEGTRSQTSTVQRFHKGAFFLAEQLRMPITPVYLHGNAESLPKGDFIIYNGLCHIHVGEPIDFSNTEFGETYQQRSKNIARLFKANFKQIRLIGEDEDFFRQKLLLNYRYKESNILSQIKEDFRKHKAVYYRLFKEIDEGARIAHITTDIGQVDFLLVHQFASRRVTTFNLTEEHRDISRASYIIHKFQVRYVDRMDFLWEGQEVLLLSKVTAFEQAIPAHIQKIIVLCASLNQNFVDFTVVEQVEDYIVYHRNEGS